jgi:hypothetical protein
MNCVLITIFMASLFSSVVQSAPEYVENSPLYFGVHDDNFVHRWGIQAIAQHVFDPRLEAFPTDPTQVVKVDPTKVKKGDIIFARDMPRFMKEFHPEIPVPYVLITAGDYKDRVECEYIDLLDDPKLIAWFCVHPCPRKHPKYHWLPLGIFQAREFYDKREDLSAIFKKFRQRPKTKLLCSNFNIRPGLKPERNPVVEVFRTAEFCFKTQNRPFLEYMNEMADYKFTLSPRGLGPDCYRNWEALLLGVIPILHSCYLDELYSDLPVLYVDKWEDITPEFLAKKYEEVTSKKYNIEKLFMNYWWNKITQVRDEFLRNEAASAQKQETAQAMTSSVPLKESVSPEVQNPAQKESIPSSKGIISKLFDYLTSWLR